MGLSLSQVQGGQAHVQHPGDSQPEVLLLKNKKQKLRKRSIWKRVVKPALEKSTVFAFASLIFSGMTLLRILLIPAEAFVAVIVVTGGFLLLALASAILALVFRLREMKT